MRTRNVITWALLFLAALALYGLTACPETSAQRSIPRGAVRAVEAAAVANPSETAEIDQLERDWAAAFQQRDRAALERIMAPDFFETTTKGRLRNREDTISGLMKSKATLTKIELSDTKVLMKGNIAIATGIATEEGKEENGKRILDRVRYTDIFEKRGGTWFAIVEHTSELAAAQ